MGRIKKRFPGALHFLINFILFQGVKEFHGIRFRIEDPLFGGEILLSSLGDEGKIHPNYHQGVLQQFMCRIQQILDRSMAHDNLFQALLPLVKVIKNLLDRIKGGRHGHMQADPTPSGALRSGSFQINSAQILTAQRGCRLCGEIYLAGPYRFPRRIQKRAPQKGAPSFDVIITDRKLLLQRFQQQFNRQFQPCILLN